MPSPMHLERRIPITERAGGGYLVTAACGGSPRPGMSTEDMDEVSCMRCRRTLVFRAARQGMIPASRLQAALSHYGWGPREGTPVFRRVPQGWMLGNGVVVTPWHDKPIPEHAGDALVDIEEANGYRYVG